MFFKMQEVETTTRISALLLVCLGLGPMWVEGVRLTRFRQMIRGLRLRLLRRACSLKAKGAVFQAPPDLGGPSADVAGQQQQASASGQGSSDDPQPQPHSALTAEQLQKQFDVVLGKFMNDIQQQTQNLSSLVSSVGARLTALEHGGAPAGQFSQGRASSAPSGGQSSVFPGMAPMGQQLFGPPVPQQPQQQQSQVFPVFSTAGTSSAEPGICYRPI